jgi:hypothetical protein
MRIVQIIDGVPSETIRLVGTDVAQSLSASVYEQFGRYAKAMLLTVESATVRVAFGGKVPTQGGSAIGHLLYVGDILELESLHCIQSLRFINGVAGQTAVLQLTLTF